MKRSKKIAGKSGIIGKGLGIKYGMMKRKISHDKMPINTAIATFFITLYNYSELLVNLILSFSRNLDIIP